MMTSLFEIHGHSIGHDSVSDAFVKPIQSSTLTRWERKALQASAREKRATLEKGDLERDDIRERGKRRRLPFFDYLS
jgi:hypothetical protein